MVSNVLQHYVLMYTSNIRYILRPWKSRQYEFVRTTRTTRIIVNLVFSGVLQGSGGIHV